MTQLRELHAEYLRLKEELFGGSMFVILGDADETTKRYDQLNAFFNPWFRTKDWINPMLPAQSAEICDSQAVEEYELYYS